MRTQEGEHFRRAAFWGVAEDTPSSTVGLLAAEHQRSRVGCRACDTPTLPMPLRQPVYALEGRGREVERAPAGAGTLASRISPALLGPASSAPGAREVLGARRGAEFGAADSVPGFDPAQEWMLEDTGEMEPVREAASPEAMSAQPGEATSVHASDPPMDWEWDLATGRMTTTGRWHALVSPSSPPSSDELGPEEVLGRLDPISRDRMLAELARSLSVPSERREVRVNVRTDTGELCSVGVRLAAVADASGEYSRVRATLTESLPAGAKGMALCAISGPLVAVVPRPVRSESETIERPLGRRDGGPRLGVSARAALEDSDALASLRESEARYAIAADVAQGGLWEWNLRTGAVYFSPRWASTLGLDVDALAPTLDAWFGRVHPEDIGEVRACLERHVAARARSFEMESRVLHADGTYRWMSCRGALVVDGGGPHRVAGSLIDISARKHAEEQLARGSLYDAMTGLPNRAKFTDLVSSALQRFRADPGAVFGVMALSVDRLQLVSHGLGHDVGERLVGAFATRLSEHTRGADPVARLGEGEFAVLLSECVSVAEAAVVAERIQGSLSRAFEVGEGGSTYVSASVGIALVNESYDAGDTLVRDAETAMERAKAAGRAQHAVFTPAMQAQSRSLLRLHTDLRHAIERGELEVQYQPIIEMRTGRVSGFEALMRWRHQERGLIWPEEFIPVAEENGIITVLSQWVLRQACRQLAEWGGGRGGTRQLSMSVNLSSSSFESMAIVDEVRLILEETGIAPSSLRLEVTETVWVEHTLAAGVFASLQALGVQLYLDDFGTGYSSLSYLQELNVDGLKIDRSFVAKMHDDSEPGEIVQAITTLAHKLGLYVVAEGVQTPAQMGRLQEIGCDYVQGYLFARSLDAAHAHALLIEDPVWT